MLYVSSEFFRADVRRTFRIAGLIAILWTLSLNDLYLTLWASRYTSFIELNPLANQLLQKQLVPSLIGLKVGLTLIGTMIFWRLRIRRRAEAGLLVVVLLYLCLALRWSHYTSQTLVDPVHDGLPADVLNR